MELFEDLYNGEESKVQVVHEEHGLDVTEDAEESGEDWNVFEFIFNYYLTRIQVKLSKMASFNGM